MSSKQKNVADMLVELFQNTFPSDNLQHFVVARSAELSALSFTKIIVIVGSDFINKRKCRAVLMPSIQIV